MKNILIITLWLLIIAAQSFPQGTIYTPLNIKSAYEKGTRSLDGTPGKNYWQNKSEYKMALSVNPKTRLIEGSEDIKYFNNSPDTLKELLLHLYPNLYKKGVARDFGLNPRDESDGVFIETLEVNGKSVDTGISKKVSDTRSTLFNVKLNNGLLPHTSCLLHIKWHYTINEGSEIRTGEVDSTTFFVAYFYPRIAVYDDIDGWNNSEYLGQSEFYNDFSDYSIDITVPENQIVWGTGVLTNPDQVLTSKYAARYKEALTSDKVINIVDTTEYLKNITLPKTNTWHYEADNVVDFSFGISDHYLWDALSYAPDKTGSRRVLIGAAYNKASHDYYKVAETTMKILKYMSEEIPAYPYPYPAMTIFNGGSAMEYPMMVNDVSEPDSLMPGLTAHEASHTYFPFFMGVNETKYAYMDEGWAAFFDYMISENVFGKAYIIDFRIKSYMIWAGKDLDMPIFSISKYLRTPVYRNNAYMKAAAFYLILKNQLGDRMFNECLQGYMKRWNSKHPIPFDFFNTIMDVSGQDLSWLISPWFFEYGYVDLAIRDISKDKNGYMVNIEKIGKYPAPVKLTLYYDDGTSETLTQKADVWKVGARGINIAVKTSKKLLRADIFNKFILDADTSNDFMEYKKK